MWRCFLLWKHLTININIKTYDISSCFSPHSLIKLSNPRAVWRLLNLIIFSFKGFNGALGQLRNIISFSLIFNLRSKGQRRRGKGRLATQWGVPVLFNKGHSPSVRAEHSAQITIDFLCVCWFIPAIESGLFVTCTSPSLSLPVRPRPLSQPIYQTPSSLPSLLSLNI